MNIKKNRYIITGFSLVEMSVVLTVMGILVAGIIGGTHLIRAAELRNVVAEFENYRSSINTFEESYGYLPGDFPDASSYWSGISNGDGDSLIEYSEVTAGSPMEDLLAWQHMKKAGVAAGNFTGTNASASARYAFDTNAPYSDGFNNGMYMIHSENDASGDDIYNTRGTTLRLGSLADPFASGNQYPYGGIMVAKDAYSIDKKMDDGYAATGLLYTIRGHGGSGCTSAAWNAATAAYDLDDTNKGCSLVYWYRKF